MDGHIYIYINIYINIYIYMEIVGLLYPTFWTRLKLDDSVITQ